MQRRLEWLLTEARAIGRGTLVRNAASLYGSTIVTSLLGFIYWFVAARLVPARAVGIASAVQAAAQFLSIFCVVGLSTLLISELSQDKTRARSLMLTAATGVGAVALVVATGVGLVLERFSSAFHHAFSGPVGILIFALLSALTTILLVLDDSCVGLLRGDIQFRRNAVFAVSKLLLLPLLIVVWPNSSGTELIVAWLAGLAVSLATLSYQLGKVTRGQHSHFNFPGIFAKRSLMFRHHWLNLSIQSSRLVLPVLVIALVGPQATAAYTVAMLIVSFVNIIPSHFSTVLFALTPGDEVTLRREVRHTMRLCLYLALASAPFFLVFGRLILSAFGPSYEAASVALATLGFTTYPMAVKSHYVAVSRVRGRMQQAVYRTMIGAGAEIGLAAAGGILHGITGVAAGFLVATIVEAVLFAPVVFGVMNAVSPAALVPPR
jgi:O-antigen/teichoic acid export membrane protein